MFSRLAILAAALAAAACGTTKSEAPRYISVDRPTEGIFLESADGTIESGEATPAGAVTAEGLALLKRFEGEVRCEADESRHCAYNDSSAFCTIGYGHLIAKDACEDIGDELERLDFNSGVDEERATALLEKDLGRAQLAIENQMIDGGFGTTGITDFQYDALTSFVFNVGGRNFRNSTLLKELNLRAGLGENRNIAFQFSRWSKSNGQVVRGLALRRRREAEHFFKGFPLADDLDGQTLESSSIDEEALIDIRQGEQ